MPNSPPTRTKTSSICRVVSAEQASDPRVEGLARELRRLEKGSGGDGLLRLGAKRRPVGRAGGAEPALGGRAVDGFLKTRKGGFDGRGAPFARGQGADAGLLGADRGEEGGILGRELVDERHDDVIEPLGLALREGRGAARGRDRRGDCGRGPVVEGLPEPAVEEGGGDDGQRGALDVRAEIQGLALAVRRAGADAGQQRGKQTGDPVADDHVHSLIEPLRDGEVRRTQNEPNNGPKESWALWRPNSRRGSLSCGPPCRRDAGGCRSAPREAVRH